MGWVTDSKAAANPTLIAPRRPQSGIILAMDTLMHNDLDLEGQDGGFPPNFYDNDSCSSFMNPYSPTTPGDSSVSTASATAHMPQPCVPFPSLVT